MEQIREQVPIPTSETRVTVNKSVPREDVPAPNKSAPREDKASSSDQTTIENTCQDKTLEERGSDEVETTAEYDYFDDRTLLDMFGEAAKEYLTKRVVRLLGKR